MSFLDPVFGWTLLFHPFVGILLLSLIITLIINIIYKYTTDQKEMKRLKDQIEDYRKKIKASRDNPKKMMKLNNEAMGVNMEYLGKSLKPTLYTFIPIIFIFAWMNAHYTYDVVAPNEPVIAHAYFLEGFDGQATLTAPTLSTKDVQSTIQLNEDDEPTAAFALSGPVGQHPFTVQYKEFSYNGTVTIGDRPKDVTFKGKGPVQHIDVDYPRVHPLGPISIFGWRPGWLFVYIVLSISLSLATRKLMKIY
jgi:uncharacterized membrane protein (DUF106 family)